MSATTTQKLPELPPTVGDQRIGLKLYCPLLRARLTIFFTEGDIAIDAPQLVGLFQITDPDAFVRFPVQWEYDRTPPPMRMEQVYLWRRTEAAAAIMTLAHGSLAAEQFTVWLEQQHRDFYADFEATLDMCTDGARAGAGMLRCSVASAAKRLAARFGGRVTAQFVFQRMEALGWIVRDRQALRHGSWKTTVDGYAGDLPVTSCLVKIPGGTYEQVFVTEHGIALLTEHLRTHLAPLLEGDQL